jgi:hypothetical protein
VEETELALDEIPASEEATLIAEESLMSNKESDLLELTGRMVSRRGRPRDRGPARMYSKGRWWTKPNGLTLGQK